MNDLIAGVGITIVVAVLVVLPAVLVARWQDRRQASARHSLRRPHPLAVLARDLLGLLPPAPAPATWDRIRAGMRPAPRYVDTSRTLAEMAGPIAADAEVDDEFERMPLARPTYYPRHDGSIVVGERNEVLVRPVNGRYLGTQPRRTPYPSAADPVTPAQTDDDPPWDIGTAQQPAIDDAPVYGQAPVLVVDEARRLGQGLIA